MVWHAFSNIFALAPPLKLAKPWVIDGDTVDDLATGVRYRLANIDAPETGDNAKCFRERQCGEASRWAAITLVRGAKIVSVVRTLRVDRHGRHVAFVLIDGKDLGDALVKRGLARPWRGARERWCGKGGGLAKMARGQARPFDCRTCADWR